MIDLIAAAGIGGIIGFGACAVLTMGKLADANDAADWELTALCLTDDLRGAEAAHDRCADALATKDRKLSAIRDLLDTPRTIRKADLRDVLDGDA